MFKPISTRTHGIIDYAFSATLVALPFLFRWEGRAAKLAVGAGMAVLGTSMMTRYEHGVIDLLPMKAHLSIDAGENSMLLSAPKMLGARDRTAGRILAVMGAIGSAIGALTKTRSPQEIGGLERAQLSGNW